MKKKHINEEKNISEEKTHKGRKNKKHINEEKTHNSCAVGKSGAVGT